MSIVNINDADLAFGSLSARKSTTKIILHHAAATSASVETIHEWHKAREWSGIGYHFYVRKDGSIYQGRPIDKVGAHCSGQNSDSIGICFEGNYETSDDSMPLAQYDAGVALTDYIYDKYPSIVERGGHKKYLATACPGQYFPLDDMIAGSAIGNTIATSSQDETKTITVSYNANIKVLQEALNADGIKDANGNKLVVDGIQGIKTNAAIKKALLKAGVLLKGRYQVGTEGKVVKWAQVRLNTLMGCDLDDDGRYGNDTRAAVVEWQKAKNLTVDGIAGVDTLTSLL